MASESTMPNLVSGSGRKEKKKTALGTPRSEGKKRTVHTRNTRPGGRTGVDREATHER